MKSILITVTIFLTFSCRDVFQFNPNEIRLEEYEQNLNAKNIARLTTHAHGDTVKFILIGDSQRFYDEVEDFVHKVNAVEDASFVVLAGDITDFGLSKEFRWINQRLQLLKIPYISVIGNHDMLGNGALVYSKMFGPADFSFSVGRNKFICLNTNSLETGYDGTLPNMPWLKNELSNIAHYNQAFVISHIPPFDPGFDALKEKEFASLLASSGKIKLALSGHQHSYSMTTPYNDGITYLVSASMNKRSYTLVTAWGDQYKTEQKFF
jgi:3',5'-cyclic-AMP phosphodiesterase